MLMFGVLVGLICCEVFCDWIGVDDLVATKMIE
jgi:hypothetical protein